MCSSRKFVGAGIVVLLTLLVLFPQQLPAQQQHLVTSQDLQSALHSKSDSRAANLTTMQNFLSDENVQRAVKKTGADPAKVKQAVANLSDDELASLASQVQNTQMDFAAGRLTHSELTLIIGAIIIIVVVIAIAA